MKCFTKGVYSKRFFFISIALFLVSPAFAESPDEIHVESHHCSRNASSPVHLTFDDGPKIPETLKVLDTLKQHGIKATFFISTSRLKNLSQGMPPSANERKLLQVIDRMKSEGHTIGSHSHQHIEHGNLKKHSKQEVMHNLEKSFRVFDTLGLPKPVPFRFPYGSAWLNDSDPANRAMGDFVTREVLSKGYRPMHWDIDTYDWSKIKRQALPRSMLEQICSRGGGIVLMHDIHKWTADNLGTLIESIQMSGHTFASEEQILEYSSTKAPSPLISLKQRVGGYQKCGQIHDFDPIRPGCEETQKFRPIGPRKGVN